MMEKGRQLIGCRGAAQRGNNPTKEGKEEDSSKSGIHQYWNW